MSEPNPNLVSNVLKALEGIFQTYEQDAAIARQTKGDAEKASDKLNGTRTTQLMIAAEKSHKANWPKDVIDAAVKKYLADHGANLKGNSAATFGGQLKNAMSPNARASVPAIVGACNNAWKAETEALAANKDAPTPCRDAWGKKDHAIARFIGEKASGRKAPSNAKELVALAQELNPAKQIDKIVRKLKAAHDELIDYKDDADVAAILKVLGAIDAKKLLAMKNAAKAEPAEIDASEPMDGASDIETDPLDAAVIANVVAATMAQLRKKAA